VLLNAVLSIWQQSVFFQTVELVFCVLEQFNVRELGDAFILFFLAFFIAFFQGRDSGLV
jgi:hypothetical protein